MKIDKTFSRTIVRDQIANFSNTEFVDCSSHVSGGAIYLSSNASLNLYMSQFIRCSSSERPNQGGGIYMKGHSLQMKYVYANKNIAGDKGQFFYAVVPFISSDQNGIISLIDVTFSQCGLNFQGDASSFRAEGGKQTYYRINSTENKVHRYGAGFHVQEMTEMSMKYTTVFHTDGWNTILLQAGTGSKIISDSNIIGNNATDTIYGVVRFVSEYSMENCVFLENKSVRLFMSWT